MKLLLISDVESPALWDYYQPSRVEGVDAILSCGDLKPAYLEFLVTMSCKPLLYVPGNHDEIYRTRPPEGCECVDDCLYRLGDLRILGFGGCMRYNPGPYQYTEAEMRRRIRRMYFALRRAGGVDIVMTHAPMAGFGDAEDYAHRGFACFAELVDRWQPRYFIHGHIHQNYGRSVPRLSQKGNTTIVNAYERYILEV